MRFSAIDRRMIFPPAYAIALLGIGMASGCPRTADTPASASPSPEASPDTVAKTDGTTAAADTGSDSVPTVAVATVSTGTATKTLPLTGSLVAFRDRQATLSPQVAGIVDALPVRTGQSVTRGQVVLHLSTRTLEGQLEQARATIRQNQIQVQQAQVNALQQQGQTQSGILQAQTAVSGAQATLLGAEATLAGNESALANAQQSLNRAQALFKEGLVAQKDVEAADLVVRAAQAQVAMQRQAVKAQRETVRGQQQAAQATQVGRLQNVVKQQDIAIARQQFANARGALTTLESQRAQYTVRAPLSGSVSLVGASVGEAVDTTTKVLTITDLSRLQLQIAVPSVSASQVGVGQSLTFAIDALPGRTFTAVIRSIGKQVDATNGTVTAIAEVANPGQFLKDGMFARVQVVTARHPNARLVPRAAVLFDAAAGATTATDGMLGGPANVLKIASDGTVHTTPVTTGWTVGDQIEIVSGNLRPGDRVATTGAFGLEDGAKVTVEGQDAKADSGKKGP